MKPAGRRSIGRPAGRTTTILAYLVEKGAGLDALDNTGTAPLHSLASRGNAEGIRILLAKGADINVPAPNKSTPVHFAALGRQVEALRLLAEHKADLESRDERGRTPLVVAAREMAGPEVVRTLLGPRGEDRRRRPVRRYGLIPGRLARQRRRGQPPSGEKGRFPGQHSGGRQLLGFAVSKGLADLFSRMAEKGAEMSFETGTEDRSFMPPPREGPSRSWKSCWEKGWTSTARTPTAGRRSISPSIWDARPRSELLAVQGSGRRSPDRHGAIGL